MHWSCLSLSLILIASSWGVLPSAAFCSFGSSRAENIAAFCSSGSSRAATAYQRPLTTTAHRAAYSTCHARGTRGAVDRGRSLRCARNKSGGSGQQQHLCTTDGNISKASTFPHSTTAATAHDSLTLQRQLRSSSTSDGTEGLDIASGGRKGKVRDADRMFRVATALHLRRHRSPASRDIAVELLLDSMRLRPDWIATDSKFAVDSRVNSVLADFSSENDHPGEHGTSRGHDGSSIRRQADPNTVDAVACFREMLDRVGYTAYGVQQRMGPSVGPVPGQRLPGPYYLHKKIDHTQAMNAASLGPLCDSLDVAIRMFLLGLALPRAEVERFLGSGALASAEYLGLLTESPADPSLEVSMVQLFPLDADAMLPLSSSDKTAVSEKNVQSQKTRHNERSAASATNVSMAGDGDVREGASSESFPRTTGGDSRMVPASDLVFATDWPPPAITSLTDEPVMYIGPDSIGLVQHAPRRVSGPLVTGGGRQEETRSIGTADPNHEEVILDLCCGSGIQGIAAAARRGGNAFVTCVDLNPRAVRFSRFNACLNRLEPTRFEAFVGDLYHPLDARAALAKSGWSRDDTGVFDLILANPPFVPVPPKLDFARRRYYQFSSGGSTGEEVLRGIFLEALERLRPGGVLAVVSELANPGMFDLKLEHWIGPQRAVQERLAFSARAFPPTADRFAMERDLEGVDISNAGSVQDQIVINLERDGVLLPDSSAASPTGASAGSGKPQGKNRLRRRGKRDCRWTGVVFHEKQPWSASEYAARRGGSRREAEGWVRHLEQVGIEEMAAGFVFVCKGGERRGMKRTGAAREGSAEEEDTFTATAVRVEGVEKLWAPHNRAAMKETGRALREMGVVEK